MKLQSYIHPVRTFLPCSGAGRFINNTLLELNKFDDVKLKLLYAEQWNNSDSRLPENAPLRNFDFSTFPMPENRTERLWKTTGHPKMDKYIDTDTDWIYTPMETYFPVSKCPLAITIFDIQAFEPDLPWSQSFKHKLFRYKWGKWVKKAINKSEVVFTISEFSKSRMVSLLGADEKKIVNVGCGVEKDFFDVRNESNADFNLPTNKPYALMIGGLRQKKGGDFYLNIAKELVKQKSDIQIVFAGNSDQKYIDAASNLPNIKLLGLVKDTDLPNLLKNSLCLLFLSLYEGFGIPPLEAMAAETVSIVSNKASLPEVVGDAGIVVNPYDTTEIVDIIINLSKDSALRDKYIKKGIEHVANYSWTKTAETVFNTLNKT